MAETLFGLIGSLDPTILIAVFIGLIFLLIFFETALHLLEEFAIDSGYEDLLRRLYKEMMMMGYLSFGVFLAFNAAGLKHDQQYLAFEFSHITTFFIAIFFVVRACLFVQYTRTSKQYFKSVDNTTITSLMKRYQDLSKNSWTFDTIFYKYLPSISSLRRAIEYHILKDFFFQTYRLIPSEFRYVNYLSKNYKFYVIELTEIRPLCWFVPILLILLNYFRVQVIGDVGIGLSCDHSHHYYNNSSYYDDDHHRMLGSGDGDDVSYQVSHTCEEYLIPYALFCSGLLVFFAIIVVIITIHSKNKLLVLAGVKSEDDILNILRRLMVQEQYAARQQMQQESELPQESLPSTTSFEKNQMQDLTNETKKMSRQSSLFSFNTVPQEEYQVCTLRVMLHIHKEEQEAKAHQWLHTFYHYLFVISRIFQFKFNSRNQRTMTPMIERVKSMKLKAQLERTESGEVDSESENKEDDDDSCDIEMQIPFPYPKKDHDHGHDDEYLDPSTHPLAHEIHSVFPFSSRELYEFLIQEMLLLDSLFLALWATNFITMSLHSEHQVSYNLIFLVPIFLMTLLNFVIMFLSSTLFALTSLKNKGAEWICEQVDICQKVLPHLRREILTILPDGANDKRIVDLYRLITDTNISEKRDPQHPSTDEGIKLEGFAQFLQILDMHPSEKEIRALFRSMDKDDSGSIELSELKLLLLDPNVAEIKLTKHKKKNFIDI